MRIRTKLLLVGIPIGLVLLAPVAFLAFWMSIAGGSDAGSPTLAALWRDELAAYESPAVAIAADSSIEHKSFADGTWVIARSRDSHGMWHHGGGTVVVRDSQGSTRAFFGHVCGDNSLAERFDRTPDLTTFYKKLTQEFQEHKFD